MNWADLTLVLTPLMCALSAGAVAADQKMGWVSCFFALGGLVIGCGCGVLARALGMLCLVAGCKASRTIATFGLLVAYMLVPMAVMFGAFAGTAWLSAWITGASVPKRSSMLRSICGGDGAGCNPSGPFGKSVLTLRRRDGSGLLGPSAVQLLVEDGGGTYRWQLWDACFPR